MDNLLDRMKDLLGGEDLELMKNLFNRVQPPSLTNKKWVASRKYVVPDLKEYKELDSKSEYYNMSILLKDTYSKEGLLPDIVLNTSRFIPGSFSDVEIKGVWKIQSSGYTNHNTGEMYKDILIMQNDMNKIVIAWRIFKQTDSELILAMVRSGEEIADAIGFSISE